MNRTCTRLAVWTLSALLGSLAVSGCRRAAPPPTAPPAIEVDVLTLKPEPVTLVTELPGRTSAFRVAEVRARVSGIVLKRLFTEGADVREGEPLYEIDPAPYRAEEARAEASLARARAAAENARANARRAHELFGQRAISRQELDAAVQAEGTGVAEVGVAEAALQAARINLGYATVTAPISGRIGRSSVTEGAYVQQGAATLLATIQQLDPIYVDLTQSATEMLRLRQALESGRLRRAGADAAQVKLRLEGGGDYAETGQLQFSDVSVEPSTNSVSLRALFPNPRGELLPNLFVRARFEEATVPDALLVPQPAVGRNARGEATALVVGAEDKAELRVLAAERAIGDRWLVARGLAPGDRVIVSNLQRVRPGAQVRVAPAAPSPAPAR